MHTDDTMVPIQSPGEKQCRKGRIWCYLGDADNPYVVYDYTPNRKRDGPATWLAGYCGYLQADAYGGYDGIYHAQSVTEVACWAHASRKFYDAQDSATPPPATLRFTERTHCFLAVAGGDLFSSSSQHRATRLFRRCGAFDRLGLSESDPHPNTSHSANMGATERLPVARSPCQVTAETLERSQRREADDSQGCAAPPNKMVFLLNRNRWIVFLEKDFHRSAEGKAVASARERRPCIVRAHARVGVACAKHLHPRFRKIDSANNKSFA